MHNIYNMYMYIGNKHIDEQKLLQTKQLLNDTEHGVNKGKQAQKQMIIVLLYT